jgi:hypothetical protein
MTKLNIYQKLNVARSKFHATQIKKSGRNTFANYSYFELGDFLVPALKIFEDVGLCAIISFTADAATMQIRDVETPEVMPITFTSPMGSAALKGCHEVQNIGAVETYQRRYLWVAALEIVEHDALDATTGSKAVAPKQDEAALDDVTIAEIISLCEAIGGNQAQVICEAYKVSSIPELSAKQAVAVVKRLTEKLKEKEPA